MKVIIHPNKKKTHNYTDLFRKVRVYQTSLLVENFPILPLLSGSSSPPPPPPPPPPSSPPPPPPLSLCQLMSEFSTPPPFGRWHNVCTAAYICKKKRWKTTTLFIKWNPGTKPCNIWNIFFCHQNIPAYNKSQRDPCFTYIKHSWNA